MLNGSEPLTPHDHGQTIKQELEHMPIVENFQTVPDIFKQLGMAAVLAFFSCFATVSNVLSISRPWQI